MSTDSGSYIPIYQKLTDFYRDKIIAQDYKPGGRIDSINKIMLRHHVSRETAKLVIRRLIDEGLVISKAGKGTFVTPFAETKKIWGMIIPFYSSNMEQLISELETEAKNRGRELVYYLGYNNADEEMRRVGEMVLSGFEAIIVVPNYDEGLTAEFYRNLINGNTIVILMDNTMSGSYFRYVVQSYDLGVKRAVDYLGTATSGNLLLVTNESWRGRNLLYELMEQTFRMLVQVEYPDRKVFVMSQLKELSRNYLEQNNVKGVLCCVDVDAIRFLGRLKEWNYKVPQDIHLVNYGNTELTRYYEPAVTVIDCHYSEMASKTAQLIDKGKEAGPYEQYVIQPELLVRNT